MNKVLENQGARIKEAMRNVHTGFSEIVDRIEQLSKAVDRVKHVDVYFDQFCNFASELEQSSIENAELHSYYGSFKESFCRITGDDPEKVAWEDILESVRKHYSYDPRADENLAASVYVKDVKKKLAAILDLEDDALWVRIIEAVEKLQFPPRPRMPGASEGSQLKPEAPFWERLCKALEVPPFIVSTPQSPETLSGVLTVVTRLIEQAKGAENARRDLCDILEIGKTEDGTWLRIVKCVQDKCSVQQSKSSEELCPKAPSTSDMYHDMRVTLAKLCNALEISSWNSLTSLCPDIWQEVIITALNTKANEKAAEVARQRLCEVFGIDSGAQAWSSIIERVAAVVRRSALPIVVTNDRIDKILAHMYDQQTRESAIFVRAINPEMSEVLLSLAGQRLARAIRSEVVALLRELESIPKSGDSK